ncbi:MAG: hypothetical protein ACJAYB_003596 [Psychromonas sp.]|jgi:hypothetical protein
MTTDYNPLFSVKRINDMTKKDRILLDIINQHDATKIKITDIRDKLLVQYTSEELEFAAARRWVNGKLATFMNKGLLIRKKFPNSTKHYFEKTPYFEQYVESQAQISPPIITMPKLKSPTPKNNNKLQDELETYRQTMLSQLGEIEEYQRIKENYPDLGDVASAQFKQVVDENYRMLGRIRAIEKLIANTVNAKNKDFRC